MTSMNRRGGYIPWLFVAGFLLVVGVNGVMIWFAVGSFSGLYAAKPRERGVHYNEIAAAQSNRDALGWRVEPIWRPESQQLELAVVDATGSPLAGATASAALVRPAEKRPPIDLAFGDTGVGRFTAQVVLPMRGNWDLDIVVERPGERYAQTRRMFLK